ncbi:MAG: hypothetical protein ACI8Z1_002439 [Candidatus Azotimanducaceae bacterium]|jgi:hypothetical protein
MRKLIFGLSLSFCLLFISACQFVEEYNGREPIGRIISVVNFVQVLRGDRALELGAGSWIYEGDAVLSDQGGGADIVMKDKTRLLLSANTQLDFTRYDVEAKSARLLLNQGAINIEIKRFGHKKAGGYEIVTRFSTVSAKNSSLWIGYDRGDDALIAFLLEGESVIVRNRFGAMSLSKEQSGVRTGIGEMPVALDDSGREALRLEIRP